MEKLTKRLILVLVTIFMGGVLFSFVGYALGNDWSKTYGGTKDDKATSVQQTSDGGYIVAGYTKSNDGDVKKNNGDSDYWIVKLDSSGKIVWSKTYGGTEDDRATSIQQTKDGGYIVAGYTFSNDKDVKKNKGVYDYWILKLNSKGKIDWSKTYGGTKDDSATSIQQTKDGGYIVAGYTMSNDGDVKNNKGYADYWILKLNPEGKIIWSKTYGGTRNDYATSMQQTEDGGYIITGIADSSDGDVKDNNGGSDYWVLKLDPKGNIQWSKTYGGSKKDRAFSISQTKDGGYIVAGYTKSGDKDIKNNKGKYDVWLIKLNLKGKVIWSKTYGGSSYDSARFISQTKDGGYIVTGYAESSDGDLLKNNGDEDYWILKLNSKGKIEWSKTYGGTESDYATSIQQTKDGGYVIAGYTDSSDKDVSKNRGNTDLWVIKLDKSGNL